jgi:uncharacterized glyoxalase superfamily protein PhnB
MESKLNIPAGQNTVMPYLILKHAPAFLEFARTVFNAREGEIHRHSDNSIMHGQIIVGDSTIMFADSGEQWPPMTAGLFVYVADADDSYDKALAAGGTTVMGLSDQEYGRTCGVKDPCGNTWWITSLPG